MKICICSSMAFYEKFMELKPKLEKLGHEITHPELRVESHKGKTSVRGYFEENGGIDAFAPEHDIWKKKSAAIKAHFAKIDDSDAVLITNYEKKGIDNYIGGNTFLEIGYAFGKDKKIFILNEIPKTSAYKEEILGMQPTVLHGDITEI